MHEKWLQAFHTVAKEGGLISWPKPFTHATDIKKGVGEDTFRMGHAPRQHFLRVFEVDFGVGQSPAPLSLGAEKLGVLFRQ